MKTPSVWPQIEQAKPSAHRRSVPSGGNRLVLHVSHNHRLAGLSSSALVDCEGFIVLTGHRLDEDDLRSSEQYRHTAHLRQYAWYCDTALSKAF